MIPKKLEKRKKVRTKTKKTIMSANSLKLDFDIDLSFLNLRNPETTSFPDEKLVLEGTMYTLFSVSNVSIHKSAPGSARLRVTSFEKPPDVHLPNGTLQLSSFDTKTYDLPIRTTVMIVFHRFLGYGIIEYQPVWCSSTCTSQRKEDVCGGCFSKSYWSMVKVTDQRKHELFKMSLPPVMVINPRRPTFIIQAGALIIDYRDIRDENKCEGGHILPLTLAILAVLSKYGCVLEDFLYRCMEDYNFTSYDGVGWSYTPSDVKQCLRTCTYRLEYIDNFLDDDDLVTYRLLPKGKSFIEMFQT